MDLAKVTRMAGLGLRDWEIAAILGMSEDTFQRRKADDPAVLRAYEKGVAEVNGKVAQRLFRWATSNDPRGITAAIWWEKTRAGKSEKMQHEHAGPGGEQLVVRVVPMAPGPER